MENHSPEDDILADHLPSMAEEEDDGMEEHFPAVSLDDDFGWKIQFQRGTCAFMNMHNMLCAFIPGPYDFNQVHPIQEDVEDMDLIDIFDFPDVIVSADDDMPSLEDILKLWRRWRK